MNDKTCKTCRYWNAADARLDPQGVCEAGHFVVLSNDQTGPWADLGREPTDGDKIPGHYEYGRPMKPDDFGALDGSGYFGCVVTGPDFGCIKHEPKGGADATR